MQLIYNTQSQKKEPFTTITPNEVKMYVCGPTVYGRLHVGNFRGPVFFNLVRNWLTHSGYKVTFVYNYTDVDDKIIAKAKEEGVSSSDVSERYIAEFEKDFNSLHLKAHSQNPRVTTFMESIVEFVKGLVESKKAYVTATNSEGSSDVVFSISKFPEYGKLSGRNPEELLAGARVEKNDSKENPLDFVLWKAAKPGEPAWSSPWGKGRPGWHIECSAMVRGILGDQIDIHGGGSDLIFPHHENEIAQSEALTGKLFVKYWMHNNMLTFGSQKMSKSLGNIRSLRDFVGAYNAEIYKYIILSVHYRSLLDFSEDGIQRSLHGLGRIYSTLSFCERVMSKAKTAGTNFDVGMVDSKVNDAFAAADQGISDALNDDFNTAEVFARIFEVVRLINSVTRGPGAMTPARLATAEKFFHWLRSWGELFSLFQEEPTQFLMDVDDKIMAQKGLTRDTVQAMVTERSQARSGRDFKKADQLRDELAKLGVLLFDSIKGTEWEMKK